MNMNQDKTGASKGECRQLRPSPEMQRILSELLEAPPKARMPRQERPSVTGSGFPWPLLGRVLPGLAVTAVSCWIGWVLLVGIERLPLPRDPVSLVA